MNLEFWREYVEAYGVEACRDTLRRFTELIRERQGAEAAALLAYSLLWQLVLRRMPLSFAYSNKGVCTLWTALFGLAFFGEQMTWGKAAGLVVVLAGVALVVTDHE